MGRNEESPALSLSLSDYSISASSQKPFILNSTNDTEKNKIGNVTCDIGLNHDKIDEIIYLDSHTDSAINIPGAAITSSHDSAREKLAIHGPPLPSPPPPLVAPCPPMLPTRPLKPSYVSRLGPSAPGAPPPPVISKASPRQPPLPSGNVPPTRPPLTVLKTPPAPPPPPPVAPSPPRSLTSSYVNPHPPPPPLPPVPFVSQTSPRLHPMSSGSVPPPRPPTIGLKKPSGHSPIGGDDVSVPKAKLKPFFWEKVLANPNQSMVWHHIKSGSFQFNEEMLETLFGYAPAEKNKSKSKVSTSQESSNQYIRIIDPRKSQNLSILLKALNVTTEEVTDALQEGNELPSELIYTLLKMAPTTDEELKLMIYNGELTCLGPAERFLKVLVDIPFAFKRLEELLFMSTLQEEKTTLKGSFSTLEAACNELRESRMFLKLLEAVLKTGNRMNDGSFRGGAQAFKLDTLLKLSDVKGVDGKTTLLHFVVQEIIRSEGVRAACAAQENGSTLCVTSDDLHQDTSRDAEEHYRSFGLQVVSGLVNELENVRRAAILDADSLSETVSKLGNSLIRAQSLLNSEMANTDEESGFHQALRCFVQNAEVDIQWLLDEEKRIMALVKSTCDYFHGNSAKDEGLRLFVIVRDFLIVLDKVCKEVKDDPKNTSKSSKYAQTTPRKPSSPPHSPFPDPHQQISRAIKERRKDVSSSESDEDRT